MSFQGPGVNSSERASGICRIFREKHTFTGIREKSLKQANLGQKLGDLNTQEDWHTSQQGLFIY